MSEEELLQRQKNEKREKVDIILAYILIVILLACILFVVYLKFIRKDDKELDNSNEYLANVIKLDNISSLLNDSDLASKYRNDNATFTSTTSDDLLVVNYAKDDRNLNINIPLNTNELEIELEEDNMDILTDIYKEIANIICVYYGNSKSSCESTIDKVDTDNSIEGIRFDTLGDNTIVYIDIMKKIEVNSDTIYNEVTSVPLAMKDYTLVFDDIEINNINVNSGNEELKFNGHIKSDSEEERELSIIVKLFDDKGSLLGENKYEFTGGSPLVGEGDFEVSFILSDNLKLEDIKEYSIEVSR